MCNVMALFSTLSSTETSSFVHDHLMLLPLIHKNAGGNDVEDYEIVVLSLPSCSAYCCTSSAFMLHMKFEASAEDGACSMLPP